MLCLFVCVGFDNWFVGIDLGSVVLGWLVLWWCWVVWVFVFVMYLFTWLLVDCCFRFDLLFDVVCLGWVDG